MGFMDFRDRRCFLRGNFALQCYAMCGCAVAADVRMCCYRTHTEGVGVGNPSHKSYQKQVPDLIKEGSRMRVSRPATFFCEI